MENQAEVGQALTSLIYMSDVNDLFINDLCRTCFSYNLNIGYFLLASSFLIPPPRNNNTFD